jgi:hypothetical protein
MSSLVNASLALLIALAFTACATSKKMSSARPSGNSPYLSDADGGSWWDARSVPAAKKTYRR